MNKKSGIQAVIFDWAGTIVDYGCVAPAKALMESFSDTGINIEMKTARRYMGLSKRVHIVKTLEIPEVAAAWKEQFGQDPDQKDIDNIYNNFEITILKYLKEYSTPVPGSIRLIGSLRNRGIAIGSTTGYTREMAEIVRNTAAENGLRVDCCITPDLVKAGRPYPWMCYMNAMELDVYPPKAIIKVGDTISDIQEGKNAGMWSVGVVRGGNELGLTIEEVSALSQEEYNTLYDEVAKRFLAAGVDFVIHSISEIEEVVDRINLLSDD